MIESRYFIKKLTSAEAESNNNNVHEIYIRLSNDFDYESFFQTKGVINENNTRQIDFVVTDLTFAGESPTYNLKFIYYENSNGEKRIPSMKKIFTSRGVKAGDSVCLESRTINGITNFYITFNRNNQFPQSGDGIYFSTKRDCLNNIELYKSLSIEQREKVFAYYIANLEERTIGEDQVKKYSHTYIPHINKYVSQVEGLTTLYDVCSLSDHDKISKIASRDNDPDPNYPGAYQSSFNKYRRLLEELHSTNCRINLYDFGAKQDMPLPLQQISYGAPGTGKSHETEEKIEKIYPDKEERKKNVFRTTFHPDSDYSTFVGAYKPFIDTVERFDTTGHYIRYQEGPKKSEVIKEERITYKFVPQAFTKAFIRAYELLEVNKPVFLVIEEINRGNCAQIFGDLFQLLDRDDNGYSKYAIKPDTDLGKYLVYNLGDKYDAEEGMKLPPNLYIRATMNTSDQSLFPIDSAFKRRWEWKYVPISKNEVNYKIEVENNGKLCHYDWWEFLDKVNTAIGSATTSEDKKLGYFFCKADKKAKKDDTKPSIITADKFVGKVIFYIWNDVFKDYGRGDGIFTYTYKEEEKKGQSVELSLLSTMIEDKEVDRTFSSFFDEKGDANHKSIVKLFEDLEIEGKEVGNSGSEEETTAD